MSCLISLSKANYFQGYLSLLETKGYRTLGQNLFTSRLSYCCHALKRQSPVTGLFGGAPVHLDQTDKQDKS